MKYTKIIDISWPLSAQTTAYKDKKVIQFHATKTFAADKARETLLTLGSHSGTHVDAPSHFLEQGSTLDAYRLEQLVGPCLVVDVTHVQEKITKDYIQHIGIKAGYRVLFKTRNSLLDATAPFDPQFVYLDASAAEFLVTLGIVAVGIDYLGIERNQPERHTHLAFLRNNIPIIEGLRLAHVQTGEYFLSCLPLACVGLDGAPARAVLIENI
jgi:arylformamidase